MLDGSISERLSVAYWPKFEQSLKSTSDVQVTIVMEARRCGPGKFTRGPTFLVCDHRGLLDRLLVGTEGVAVVFGTLPAAHPVTDIMRKLLHKVGLVCHPTILVRPQWKFWMVKTDSFDEYVSATYSEP